MERQTVTAFPANLARLRHDRGISQERLGELVGVSRAAIWQYENGTAFPRIGVLENMARVFGCTVPELIDEPRPKSALTYAEVVLLANYRKLNAEGKEALEKQARVMVASGMYADA